MLHALHEEGLSYSEIARRTGYERRSVAKWLKFKAPPDRRRAALNPTSPWYFETFLAQCWKEGCGFRFKPAGYSDLKPASIPE